MIIYYKGHTNRISLLVQNTCDTDKYMLVLKNILSNNVYVLHSLASIVKDEYSKVLQFCIDAPFDAGNYEYYVCIDADFELSDFDSDNIKCSYKVVMDGNNKVLQIGGKYLSFSSNTDNAIEYLTILNSGLLTSIDSCKKECKISINNNKCVI